MSNDKQSIPADGEQDSGAQGSAMPQVEESIGGVQGGMEDEGRTPASPNPDAAGQQSPEEQAPDAGEVEWAGQVVKKAPTPDGAAKDAS